MVADMKALVKRAKAAGLQVDLTGADHLRFSSPSGLFLTTASNTPSDRHAHKNAERDLRRLGWDLSLPGRKNAMSKRTPVVLDCGCEINLEDSMFAQFRAGKRVNVGCGKHRRESKVVGSVADARERTKPRSYGYEGPRLPQDQRCDSAQRIGPGNTRTTVSLSDTSAVSTDEAVAALRYGPVATLDYCVLPKVHVSEHCGVRMDTWSLASDDAPAPVPAPVPVPQAPPAPVTPVEDVPVTLTDAGAKPSLHPDFVRAREMYRDEQREAGRQAVLDAMLATPFAEASATEIATVGDLAVPFISKHADYLERQGMVKIVKRGRWPVYTLTDHTYPVTGGRAERDAIMAKIRDDRANVTLEALSKARKQPASVAEIAEEQGSIGAVVQRNLDHLTAARKVRQVGSGAAVRYQALAATTMVQSVGAALAEAQKVAGAPAPAAPKPTPPVKPAPPAGPAATSAATPAPAPVVTATPTPTGSRRDTILALLEEEIAAAVATATADLRERLESLSSEVSETDALHKEIEDLREQVSSLESDRDEAEDKAAAAEARAKAAEAPLAMLRNLLGNTGV